MASKVVQLVSISEREPPPRFRCPLPETMHSEVELIGLEEWLGACAVKFQINSVQYQDIFSCLDEALLVAGLLRSPAVGASDIRILASKSVEGSYGSATEWGRSRLGDAALRDLLSWWAL